MGIPSRKIRPLRKVDHYRWLRSDGTPNFSDRIASAPRDAELIMKRDVKCVTPSAPIIKTIEEMASSYRSLPVVSMQRIVGVVSSTDIVNYLGGGELYKIVENRHNYNIFSALYRERTESVMENKPIVAKTSDSVKDILSKMIYSNIGFLPVVDEELRVVGVITEHDLVKYLYGVASLGMKAIQLASRPVITINREDSLQDAMRKMVTYGFRRLPVVDKDVVVGMITSVDIVKFFGEHEAIRRAVNDDIRSVLSIRVEEVMNPSLIAVSPEDDGAVVVREMLEKDVSSVLVVGPDGTLEGIITERDVLYALVTPP